MLGPGFRRVTPRECGVTEEIPEEQQTLEGNASQKAHYLNAVSYTHLDVYKRQDMDQAVERVEQAVRNNEKIMVYGDYDVDGCTAVALVYKMCIRDSIYMLN